MAIIDANIIKNHERFYKKIEQLVARDNLTVMEAIVAYCEENEIDIETVVPVVKNNLNMVFQIQQEAEDLHYLPKTSKLF